MQAADKCDNCNKQIHGKSLTVCECTFLDELSVELRNNIERYKAAISDVAEVPFTKDDISWLLDVRREIAYVTLHEEYCETRYWSLSLDDRYSDTNTFADICIAHVKYVGWAERSTHVEFKNQGTGRESKESVNMECRHKTILKVTASTNEGRLLDIKSMFMLMKRRFDMINQHTSREYAKKSALKFLTDIQEHITYPFNEEYMFASMANMELEYDMTRDVDYMSVVEAAINNS